MHYFAESSVTGVAKTKIVSNMVSRSCLLFVTWFFRKVRKMVTKELHGRTWAKGQYGDLAVWYSTEIIDTDYGPERRVYVRIPTYNVELCGQECMGTSALVNMLCAEFFAL